MITKPHIHNIKKCSFRRTIRVLCKPHVDAKDVNTINDNSSIVLYEKLKIVINEANSACGDEELIKIWEKVKYYSNAYKLAKQNEQKKS
jgi:hypothetical protein